MPFDPTSFALYHGIQYVDLMIPSCLLLLPFVLECNQCEDCSYRQARKVFLSEKVPSLRRQDLKLPFQTYLARLDET